MLSPTNRRQLPAMAVLVLLVVNLSASDVQIGRYATVRALPTDAQRDVLAMTDTFEFDVHIQTVGDAVAVILEEVGFELADPATADPHRERLLGLPLPVSHRSLGPLSARLAFSTLIGPGWRLVEDPADRLVSFERCKVPRP
ncbi:MAG: hypothetical protein F4W90_11400 [Gammaproteobacteria bacterium]|nr:hypothetical protein [Gammaproteobacteria bacterium]